jgi:hypothetical protein
MKPYGENEELKKNAPILGGLEKKELHKVPAGYFDNLPERVLAQINEAPVLFGLEKKELVEVPAGYFSTIESRIKDITANKKEARVISIRMKVLRWTAAAACICLMVVEGYMFKGDSKITKGGAIAAIPQLKTGDDATNYLVDELHEDDLIAYISEQETTTEKNEVVEYLMENDYELE